MTADRQELMPRDLQGKVDADHLGDAFCPGACRLFPGDGVHWIARGLWREMTRESMKHTVRLGQIFTRLLWLEFFVAALLLALALLWHIWRPVGLWEALEWSFGSLLLGVVAALPPLFMIPLVEVRQSQRFAWVRAFRRTITTRLVPLVGAMPLGEVLTVSCLAGVSEEVFFRGVLQHEIGLLPASLVFGVLHALSVPYMLWATAVGCYLGWLAQVSGNLWLPITTHALVDIVGLGYIRFVVAPRATDVSSPLDA